MTYGDKARLQERRNVVSRVAEGAAEDLKQIENPSPAIQALLASVKALRLEASEIEGKYCTA